MGLNSTGTAHDFGQLGSAYIAVAITDLTPPDGMVITAITMVGDNVEFDKLTVDTSKNSLVYGGTESNNAYFGIGNANPGGNSEAVVADGTPKFPAGLTMYGRWTTVSLRTTNPTGGIICYFGY